MQSWSFYQIFFILLVSLGGTFLEKEETVTAFLNAWIERYQEAWKSARNKLSYLENRERENLQLRLENAQLRIQLETSQYKSDSEMAQRNALNAQKGMSYFRYKIPDKLAPLQLYHLSLYYFTHREYEKAAVIFTHLTEEGKKKVYRTAKNLLIAGLIYYKLKKYTQADAYFEAVLGLPSNFETVRYQAQARLWKALIAQVFKNLTQVQYWLNQLMIHHPRSQEVKWVNHQ